MISQKSLINIGLALIFITTSFWGGYSLAEVRTALKSHEQADIHPGAVPREAVELQLRIIDQRLQAIEDEVKEIKDKLADE